MKLIFLFIALLLPCLAHADFVASLGLEAGGIESGNSTATGKPVVESPTVLGFKGEIELGHSYFTLFGAFNFSAGKAKSQYNFSNPLDASDQAQVTDLATTVGLSRLSGGARVKLLKLKTFRLFVGAGYQYGFLNLVYDKDDFKEKHNSTNGFEESELQRLKGGFGQVGMDVIFTANSGLRLLVQKSSLKTDEFKTLGNKELNFNFTTISLAFIQYIN